MTATDAASRAVCDIRCACVPLREQAVGEKGMEILTSMLVAERNDTELVKGALETLIAVCSCSVEKMANPHASLEGTVGVLNSAKLVATADNVAQLLSLLEEDDFYVRYDTIQLLSVLLENKLGEVQEAILANPNGVPRLVDTIADRREIIRNEGLLLLGALTSGNPQIQQIVTFDGAIENLLNIVRGEGFWEGGIIVLDCLELMANLLSNTVARNYFRESSCIQQLQPPFVNVAAPTGQHHEPFFTGALALFDLLTVGGAKEAAVNQEALFRHVLPSLVSFAFNTELTDLTRVRDRALCTVGRIIRGHPGNQQAFVQLPAEGTSSGATEDLVVFMLARASLNSPEIQHGAAFVLECLFHNNYEAKMACITSLNASSGEAPREPHFSITQELLAAVVAPEIATNAPYRRWYACEALAAILRGNMPCQELLLKLPLKLPGGDDLMSDFLLPCVTRALTVASSGALDKSRDGSEAYPNEHDMVALLRLLVVWLDKCPPAVRIFKQSPQNLPFMVELVTQTRPHRFIQGIAALVLGLCLEYTEDVGGEISRKALLDIISNRIGLVQFAEKLEDLRIKNLLSVDDGGNNEALNLPNVPVNAGEPGTPPPFLDAGWVKAAHKSMDLINTRILTSYAEEGTKKDAAAAVAEQSAPAAPESPSAMPSQNADLEGMLEQYKDIIRRQDMDMESLRAAAADWKEKEKELERLREQAADSRPQQRIDELTVAVEQLKADNTSLSNELAEARSSASKLGSTVAELEEARDSLQKALEAREEEMSGLAAAYNQLEEQASASADNADAKSKLTKLRVEHNVLQEKYAALESRAGGEPAPAPAAAAPAAGADELEALRARIGELETLVEEKDEEFADLNDQHEDLLVCLAEESERADELQEQVDAMQA